jgi:hydrogenase nickel incorporation protein HypA/HybF
VHELAIAESVLQIATQNACGRRVCKVELKVGYLRQVVPSALEFGFGLLAEGTPCEGAELEIEVVPAAGCCVACGGYSEFESFPLCCAHCGSPEIEVTAGQELLVDSLEVEDYQTEGMLATSGGGEDERK